MKNIEKKIFPLLSFPDFDIQETHLDLNKKTLEIRIEGAWLDLDEGEELGEGTLFFTNWDEIKAKRYDIESNNITELFDTDIEPLVDICEFVVERAQVHIKGFGTETGQWVEWKILNADMHAQFEPGAQHTQIPELSEKLYDDDAPIAERRLAAQKLAYYKDKRAFESLIKIASDPSEDPLLLQMCGESLGILWTKFGVFDQDQFRRLRPAAKEAATKSIQKIFPDWLEQYEIEDPNRIKSQHSQLVSRISKFTVRQLLRMQDTLNAFLKHEIALPEFSSALGFLLNAAEGLDNTWRDELTKATQDLEIMPADEYKERKPPGNHTLQLINKHCEKIQRLLNFYLNEEHEESYTDYINGRVEKLIEVLIDREARDDERMDAAMYLAETSDIRAIAPLVEITTDEKEDRFILPFCGEALAQLWITLDCFNMDIYQRLVPEAQHAAYLQIECLRPELIIQHKLAHNKSLATKLHVYLLLYRKKSINIDTLKKQVEHLTYELQDEQHPWDDHIFDVISSLSLGTSSLRETLSNEEQLEEREEPWIQYLEEILEKALRGDLPPNHDK